MIKRLFLCFILLVSFASAIEINSEIISGGVVGVNIVPPIPVFNNATAFVNNSVFWDGQAWNASRYGLWKGEGTTISPFTAGDDLDMGTGTITSTPLTDTSLVYSDNGKLVTSTLIHTDGTNLNLDIGDLSCVDVTATSLQDTSLVYSTNGKLTTSSGINTDGVNLNIDNGDLNVVDVIASGTLESDMILDTDSVVAIDNDERWLKAPDGDIVLDWATAGLADFRDSNVQIDSDTSGPILGDAQDKKIFANATGMFFKSLVGATPYFFDDDIETIGTISNAADDSKHTWGLAGVTDSYIQFGGTNLEFYSAGDFNFGGNDLLGINHILRGDTDIDVSVGTIYFDSKAVLDLGTRVLKANNGIDTILDFSTVGLAQFGDTNITTTGTNTAGYSVVNQTADGTMGGVQGFVTYGFDDRSAEYIKFYVDSEAQGNIVASTAFQISAGGQLIQFMGATSVVQFKDFNFRSYGTKLTLGELAKGFYLTHDGSDGIIASTNDVANDELNFTDFDSYNFDNDIIATGTNTAGYGVINQTADGLGLQINGFDDVSASNVRIHMNSGGDTNIISTDAQTFTGESTTFTATVGDVKINSADDFIVDLGGKTTDYIFGIRDSDDTNLFVVDGTGNINASSGNYTTLGRYTTSDGLYSDDDLLYLGGVKTGTEESINFIWNTNFLTINSDTGITLWNFGALSTKIADESTFRMGGGNDVAFGYTDATDEFQIVDGQTLGTNVRLALDSSGDWNYQTGNIFNVSNITADQIEATTTTAGEGGVFGNAFIGNWIGSTSYASFSHENFKGVNTDYAFIQQNTGETFFNAKGGTQINFNIGGNNRWTIEDGGNLRTRAGFTYGIQFRDAQIFINSATDGHMDLNADVSIDLNAPLVDAGSANITTTAIGNTFGGMSVGNTTGNTTFNNEGQLELHGTARAKRELIFKATSSVKGASAPDDVLLDIGASGDIKEAVVCFSDVTQQDIYGTFHTPDDLDESTNVSFHLMWMPNTDWSSGNYSWNLEYIIKKEDAFYGDANSTNGTTTTITEVITPSNNQEFIETEFTTTFNLKKQEVMTVHFYRDVANDDGDADGCVRFFEAQYTVNSFGKYD